MITHLNNLFLIGIIANISANQKTPFNGHSFISIQILVKADIAFISCEVCIDPAIVT